MTHHFKVISRDLPTHFLRATLNRPWMRLYIFLDDGPLARTPEHYKKFIYDWKVAKPSPVHYIPEPGLWKRLEDGVVRPVQNIPIPLKYPIEMNQGLWGGEGVIKGFRLKDLKRTVGKLPKYRWTPMLEEHDEYYDAPIEYRPIPKYWIPKLFETVLYSEVLNKHTRTVTTKRAQDLIDQNYGLDFYLLKTPPCDLVSELALKLRREILYTLLHKTLYPDDAEKREEIYNKYKEFIIPEEELEWFGLTLAEAYRKQKKIEEEQAKVGPYKNIFRKEFIEQLKLASIKELETSEEEKKKSLLEKLSNLSLFKSQK